jgi:glycosyltransferase involved in cell wall biosynthesis
MEAIENVMKPSKPKNSLKKDGKMPKMKLSIVIPAYNEEKRIKKTLESLVDRFNGSCEILVVSESSDKTDDIVTDFSKNSTFVRLLPSNRRLGKGGAFKKGVKNAHGEIVLLLDSDLPVPVSDVEKIISLMRQVDVAVASREVEGTKILVYPPLARVFAGKAFSRIFNVLFDLNVKDTQCGCKAFKREALEKVIYNVESNGFEFDAELLFKCKKAGYKIREVPVTWSYKPDSKLNLFRDTLKMGSGVIKLWVKTYIVTQKT